MQIKDLSIFHNLDDTEFKKSLVCTQSVIHEYKKNDYIFFQGDVPNKLYLILNGEVELGSINVNGKVLRITNISEGEDFGEVELFLNKDRYSGYAKAKTDVKLLEITAGKDFKLLVIFISSFGKEFQHIKNYFAVMRAVFFTSAPRSPFAISRSSGPCAATSSLLEVATCFPASRQAFTKAYAALFHHSLNND